MHPWSPVSTFPVSEADYGGPQAAARETTASMEDSIPVFKFKPEFSPTPASRTASLVPGPSGDRLQQAPHARDPLGALKTHSYLSSSVGDDSCSPNFSCRPCGPRLFDSVAEDSISDYGLTLWSLLERDEELFEIDDVRDEEKAIQAMWNRYIFFERRCLRPHSKHSSCTDWLKSQYLLDPRKVVIEFLETFQRTIVETAGWKGVRVWLLVRFPIPVEMLLILLLAWSQLLAKHKYLTGDDVVTVMTHYETLAGIGP